MVDDLSDYGKGAADAVQAELKAKGITADRQGVDAKTTDYSVIAQKVVASGDDGAVLRRLRHSGRRCSPRR